MYLTDRMHRFTRPAAVLAAVAAAALVVACGASSTPTSPTVAIPGGGNANPTDGSSLKVSAPTPTSPINGQLIGASKTNGPTLLASSVSASYTSAAMQYRFRIVDASGVVSQQSALVNSPSWSVPVVMSPNSKYTWNVRAEYQGLVGPWSSAASFSTPDVLPAYSRFIGNWQGCGVFVTAQLVGCVYNAVLPNDSVSDFEYVKRVAWVLRGDGAGLLLKGSGDGIINWRGLSFSISRICYVATGHLYKIVGDAGPGGGNTPGFDDNGFVDPASCVPAIDPSLP